MTSVREFLAFPEHRRRELVEQAKQQLEEAAREHAASGPTTAASSVIGLWADDAALVDQVIEDILQRRNQQDLVGTFRRFQYGPVYQLLAIRTEGAKAVADIQLLESGETATLPLEQVLACPRAE